MNEMFRPFIDNEFMRNALFAGVLVSILCAFVGTWVVLRGLAFVGDALAHGVLPGIAVALLAGAPSFAGAAAGALVMMGGVNVVRRRTRLSADTAVGLLFVGMLALGVIITSRSSSFTGDITRILFGEILGVSHSQLAGIAVVAAVVAAVTWLLRRPFQLLCIDEDLAETSGFAARRYDTVMMTLIGMVVVASFQTVGTLLVFGMLVAPSATAALFTRRVGSMMITAALLGSLSTWIGLVVSYEANLAAGASVVLTSVVLFLIALVVRGGQQGFVSGHPSHAGHSHGGHGH